MDRRVTASRQTFAEISVRHLDDRYLALTDDRLMSSPDANRREIHFYNMT
jgi:hypothetical protein